MFPGPTAQPLDKFKMKYYLLFFITLFLVSCIDSSNVDKPLLLTQPHLPEYSKALPPADIELSKSDLISIKRLPGRPEGWVSSSPYHYFGKSSDLYDTIIQVNKMSHTGPKFDKFYLIPFFKPFVQSPGGYYSVKFSWNLHGKPKERRELLYNEIGNIFELKIKELNFLG